MNALMNSRKSHRTSVLYTTCRVNVNYTNNNNNSISLFFLFIVWTSLVLLYELWTMIHAKWTISRRPTRMHRPQNCTIFISFFSFLKVNCLSHKMWHHLIAISTSLRHFRIFLFCFLFFWSMNCFSWSSAMVVVLLSSSASANGKCLSDIFT